MRYLRYCRCNHDNPIEDNNDGRCDQCGFPISARFNPSNTASSLPIPWKDLSSTVQVVTTATFSDAVEANMMKQELEFEGITAFLDDEFISGLFWYLTVAVGWVKLRVLEPQAEAALCILDRKVFNELATNQLEDIVRTSWADQTVERMFRMSVLGLGAWPLQLYSLWLLIRLLVSGRRITQYWKILAAVIFNVPIIGCLFFVLFLR